MNRPRMDYTSLADCNLLGNRMILLPEKAQIALTAWLLDKGLMVPQNLPAKLGWLSARIGAKLWKQPVQKVYANALSRAKAGPDIARDTIVQTRNHMVNGKDLNDPKSAGGFDGREFRMIEDCVLALEKVVLEIERERS